MPSGKIVDYRRCKGCLAKYKGIIRDAQGNIERKISCQTNCIVLKESLVTRI